MHLKEIRSRLGCECFQTEESGGMKGISMADDLTTNLVEANRRDATESLLRANA